MRQPTEKRVSYSIPSLSAIRCRSGVSAHCAHSEMTDNQIEYKSKQNLNLLMLGNHNNNNNKNDVEKSITNNPR